MGEVPEDFKEAEAVKQEPAPEADKVRELTLWYQRLLWVCVVTTTTVVSMVVLLHKYITLHLEQGFVSAPQEVHMGKHKMWLKRCQRESTESAAQPAHPLAQPAAGPAATPLAATAAPNAAPSQAPQGFFGNPPLPMGMPPSGMPGQALGGASAMQVRAQLRGAHLLYLLAVRHTILLCTLRIRLGLTMP